jgi:nucleotide-binding universal stress UspA family protein
MNQKIMIAMSLEDELILPLYQWGAKFSWQSYSEVHLVHVIKKNLTPLEFGIMELPSEETYQAMLPTLTKFLEDEAKKIIPSSFRGKITFHTQLDFNPAEAVTRLIKDIGCDLVVLSTRGKHGFEGLFHSSFTDHLVRFANCDVYVVRPKLSSGGEQ